MATSTQQRETLREMSPAELSALLDSATHCEMSFRDFRGSVVPIPIEGEERISIKDLPDPWRACQMECDEGTVKGWPVKNWRIFLHNHIHRGLPMEPGTANKDVLTLRVDPSIMKGKHRATVFSFTIPGLVDRLLEIYFSR